MSKEIASYLPSVILTTLPLTRYRGAEIKKTQGNQFTDELLHYRTPAHLLSTGNMLSSLELTSSQAASSSSRIVATLAVT